MKRMVMTVISTTVIFAALSGQGLWAEDKIDALEKKIADLETSLKSLNSVIEQGLTQSTPSTAIMAFYSKECPTGWLPANGKNKTPDLRGEFIRGWDTGAYQDEKNYQVRDKFYELDKNLVATPPKERPLGSWQAPTLITTAIGPDGLQQEVIEGSPKEASSDDFSSGMQADWIEDAWYSNAFKGIIYVASALAYSQNSANIKAVNESHDRPINRNSLVVFGGTRPRNVALLYCMKE